MRLSHGQPGLIVLIALSTTVSLTAQTTPAPGQPTPAPGQPAVGGPGTVPGAELKAAPTGPAGAPSDLAPGASRPDAVRELDEQYEQRRSELDEQYASQIEDLQRAYLKDLAGLAASIQGTEAREVYRRLFSYAILTDHYEAAESAARQVLQADEPALAELQGLARSITIGARIERGEYDEAIQDLRSALAGARDDGAAGPLAPMHALVLAESMIDRLIEADQLEKARELAGLFTGGGSDSNVAAYFQARQAQLALIGQPAPPIAGTDIDGQPFRLADLDGKVVLVDFWATWCPPCIARIPRLHELRSTYHDRGFEIVGVNLDAARQQTSNPQETARLVRGFLIDNGIVWPNLLNGAGGDDFARAYGVTAIPSTILIGRDGTILAVDLTGERLDSAIKAALGASDQQAAGER